MRILFADGLSDAAVERPRAGIDVLAHEPSSGTGPVDSPLARHPKVTAIHRIGASTSQAQKAVAEA